MFPSEPPRPAVAPTAKIPDDAPFPQSIPPNTVSAPQYRPGYSSGPAAMPPPVQPNPASIPPVPSGYVTPPSVQRAPNRTPSSMPPMAGSGPNAAPRASTAPAAPSRYAEPSMSMPVAPPRSRVGLIVLVLIVDIALAVSGAVLLAKGLQKSDAPAIKDPPKAEPAKAAAGSSAQLDGSASSPVVVKQSLPEALPKPPDDPPVPDAKPVEDPKPDPKAKAKPKHDTTTKKPDPVVKDVAKDPVKDPPKDPTRVDSVPAIDTSKALSNEVDLQTSRSKVDFDDCYNDFGGPDRIHGQLTVAFRVLTDGKVTNVEAVANQTGSKELANCVTGTIKHWSFAARPAAATNFMRTFNYP